MAPIGKARDARPVPDAAPRANVLATKLTVVASSTAVEAQAHVPLKE